MCLLAKSKLRLGGVEHPTLTMCWGYKHRLWLGIPTAWKKQGGYCAFFLCSDSSGRTDTRLTTVQYCTGLCLPVSSFLWNTIYIIVIGLTDHLDDTSIYSEIPLYFSIILPTQTVLLGQITWWGPYSKTPLKAEASIFSLCYCASQPSALQQDGL